MSTKRKFSRWMPLPTEHTVGVVGWLMLGGLVAAFVASAIAYPRAVAVIAFLFTATTIAGTVHSRRRLRKMASLRFNEDIGTFARAFDRRLEPFDSWVVRATWDALQPYVGFRGGRLPVRPRDDLVNDLCIDPEDVCNIVVEVAERACRSLDGWEANPYAGRINTVGDLVKAISRLPTAARDAEPFAAADGSRDNGS